MGFLDDNKMAELRRLLEKETPILTADIRALYQELDRKFGLRGAQVPISFGYEEDMLGSYTPGNGSQMEHFHFSLLFVGYAVAHPLSRADRIDLYKHEYAHYMQYNMEIPKKYQFTPGIHGSAWKYCCSLIGAAPTPYYRAGEGLMKHNYEEALRRKTTTRLTQQRDQIRQEQEYRKQRDIQVRYQVGDAVEHPKFGQGIVKTIQQTDSSVRLEIEFSDAIRKIDQKWLFRSGLKNTKA